MYTIPADPVKFRRHRRAKRHRAKVTALQVLNLMMLAAVLLTAAAQGAWR